MKIKIPLFFIIFLIPISLATAQSLQRIELSADYGPPSTADSFELFTIPITPESFGVDTATLVTALENITSFKIRTEMHTGNDVGGVDNIVVGSLHASYFDNSQEGWSSGGDGTLEWQPEGGFEGGYIQMSDWATGAFHWVIAPISWTGDWSSLFGESISFYFKTNRPSYHAMVVLTTDIVNRLVLNTTVNTVALNDSTKVKLEVTPVPTEDLTVTLSSSSTACLTTPSSLIVLAGHAYIEFYVSAAIDATIGCESVIEAQLSGYETSRLTMKTVEDNAGIAQFNDQVIIQIYPNPCKDYFRIKTNLNRNIERVVLYNLLGDKIYDTEGRIINEGDMHYTNQAPGLYMVRVFLDQYIYTGKIVIE